MYVVFQKVQITGKGVSQKREEVQSPRLGHCNVEAGGGETQQQNQEGWPDSRRKKPTPPAPGSPLLPALRKVSRRESVQCPKGYTQARPEKIRSLRPLGDMHAEGEF